MKDTLSNPVRYGKIITMQAVLLTAAINLLFFILFSVPDVKSEKYEREAATLTLLSFAGNDQNLPAIREYIRNYAPTHFSSGKSPQGFGSFVDHTIHPASEFADLGKRDVTLLLRDKKISAPLPEAISPQKILPPRAAVNNAENNTEKMPYPFAVSTTGKVIPIVLSTDEQRTANEFPLNCGVYKLILSDNMMPRLVLLRSCGRRKFDHLAMKQLYPEIKKLANCTDGEIFTVHYRDHDELGDEI